MEATTVTATPKVKHKTFTYHTELMWLDNRAGMLRAEGKPAFRVASPPEFKGEAGVWTPEDLFVAAVETCTMTTFIAFAQRLNLPVVSYHSRAEGVLEFVEGNYRFTKVILRPTVVVANAEFIEQTTKTLHDAHKSCLVANSIRAEVVLEPRLESNNQ
ncbi:OsmC family protein [candidate division KSB1 bacterium]|nr:OsmC family protein [candidate division KSB1 bacterium]